MTRPDDLSRMLRGAAPTVEASDDELDLLGIFRLARRRMWVIGGVAALVIAAALPTILAIQPAYYAQSRLLFRSPLSATLAATETAPLAELNLATELERLLSRDVSIKVIRKLGLDGLPEFNPALRPEGQDAGEPPDEAARDPIDRVVPAYLSAVSIQRSGGSNVLEIGFRSQDPALAAAVPNALLQVYLQALQDDRTSDLRRADQWLVRRMDEQRARVASAENDLRRLDQTPGPSTAEQRESTLQRIVQLNLERDRTSQARAEQTATIDAIEAAGTREQRLALTDSPDAATLGRDWQLQRSDLERLLTTLGNNSAEVSAARDKIAATEAAIDVEVDQHLKSVKAEVARLDRQDAVAVATLAAARASLPDLDAATARRQALERALAGEQDLLESLGRQQRALAAEAGLQAAEVEVLSPAVQPTSPISRGRKIYLAAAIIAAGVLGLTVACLLEVLDGSVRSFQQLRGVPDIAPGAMLPRLRRAEARRPFQYLAGTPEPRFKDAARSLAMAVERAGGGSMPASILVTSAVPGEGKTFVTSVLAFELAARGRQVLIVDTDTRRGRVHEAFDAPPEPGFADIAASRAAFAEIVRIDAATGIAYLPRGNGTLAGSARSDAIASLLTWARENGGTVIFDSAPILATIDTVLLAGDVEQMVVVARWGRTSRRTLLAALDRVRDRQNGSALVAMNMVVPHRHALYGFQDAALYGGSLRSYWKGHAG